MDGYISHSVIKAPILESGITLVHPYSRNKSDKRDCLFYILIFNSWYLGKSL